jgi:hypothetical protein
MISPNVTTFFDIFLIFISVYLISKIFFIYLDTLPPPEPLIRAVISFTVARLISPEMECFKQVAATANSKAV